MRIVGGKYRHRLISWPDDQTNTRPTKDRVREAVFSALGNISGTTVVDLYAGSGAMGLEALSREAGFCYFVDIAPIALKTIKANINSLSISQEQYMVIARKDVDAINYIDKKVDLLILDPPYKQGKYNEIIDACKNILSDKHVIVCESDHKLTFNENDYSKIKEYKYGDTLVTLLWK